MLALKRKRGESIVITVGEIDIVVQVVNIEPGKVKLGFTAPQEAKIFRTEVIAKKPKGDAA
jgi:carbon storage regulator CsrA